MIVAIDGPAGAGKSTVARNLAARLGFRYLDTGAMYRALTWLALEESLSLDDGLELEELARSETISFEGDRVFIGGRDVSEEIRMPRIDRVVSSVARHPEVREVMRERQRELGSDGDAVIEGRDIGTVVCPESPLKVHLTASEKERARRRAADTGEDQDAVLAAQRDRDARDRGREHGALELADGAVELDTTGLDVAGVVDRIAAVARERGLA